MIKKYKKKPVVIEAIKLKKDNIKMCIDFVGNNCRFGVYDGLFTIKTLEGEMRGDIGDYIIKGVKGEFYPCKPDIFEMTYESVTSKT